ncbi:MAG: CHASE3 domain-containing protein, partial [Wenzhouxiangellaceae bacterium]|nr:CHASE3 domain-containing protein [Wenzhouxiangellaceae bacterium]
MKPGVRTAIFTLALLLIGGMGVVQWLAERRLVEAQSRVPHTLRVIEVKQELLTRLVDAETGQRGFLLTGDPEYLDPFRDAEGDAWRLIASLRQLTHEIPAQQERLDVLEPLVRTHFDGLDQRIAVRESQGLEEAVRLLEENREKANLDAIRTLLADLERQEFELLALRSTRADRISTATHLVTALGTLLALFLFGWAFLSFRREARQRRQAEREEARLRAQLIEQREAAVEVSRMKSE